MSLDKNEEERISHPSFGQIRFSRINGNGTDFYGSELEQDHYISMEVLPSEINRTLSKDWYYTKRMPLINLRMTANQFAEMLTSLNHGSGVPCTVEMVDGKKVEPYQKQESRKEFIHRKFEDRMNAFAITLKQKQERARELTTKKHYQKLTNKS